MESASENRPLVDESPPQSESLLVVKKQKEKTKKTTRRNRSKSKDANDDGDDETRKIVESDNEFSVKKIKKKRKKDAVSEAAFPSTAAPNVSHEGGDVNRAFVNDEPEESLAATSESATAQPITDDVNTDTTEPKRQKRKKKKAAKSKAEPEEDGPVTCVTVHRCEQLEMDVEIVSHPVVLVSLLDESTGEALVKSAQDRPVSSFYETHNENVTRILPLMTAPFDFRFHRTIVPRWEEMLVFNEPLQRLLDFSCEQRVVVLFEILDFRTQSGDVTFQRPSKDRSRWRSLAWAFLKLLGPNGERNSERRVRLQLWRPPKGYRPQRVGADSTVLWNAWKHGQRRRYPSTLWVTVKGVAIPTNLDPTNRSKIATQREEGRYNLKDLSSNADTLDETLEVKSSPRDPVAWSRAPGQPCRIPNRKLTTLTSGTLCFRLCFSHSGRDLAASCREKDGDYFVIIFDVTTYEAKNECRHHAAIVYDICWTKKDNAIVTASGDGTARLWTLRDLQRATPEIDCIKTFPHPSFVYASQLHPLSDTILVTAAFDAVVRVWRRGPLDDPLGQLAQELEGHRRPINAICFDTDGTKLFSGDAEGVVIVWNVYVGKGKDKNIFNAWTINTRLQPIEAGITSLKTHPKGEKLFVRCKDSKVLFLDLRTGDVFKTLNQSKNVRSQLRLSVSPCGRTVWAGGEDGVVHVWNADTGNLVAIYEENQEKSPIYDVQYHPHDHLVAFSAGSDARSTMLFKFNPSNPQPDCAVSVFPELASIESSPRTSETSKAKFLQPGITSAMIKEKLDRLAPLPSSGTGDSDPFLSPKTTSSENSMVPRFVTSTPISKPHPGFEDPVGAFRSLEHGDEKILNATENHQPPPRKAFNKRLEDVKRRLDNGGGSSPASSTVTSPRSKPPSSPRPPSEILSDETSLVPKKKNKKKANKEKVQVLDDPLHASADPSIDDLMKMMDDLDAGDENAAVSGRRTKAKVVDEELRFFTEDDYDDEDDEDSRGSRTPLQGSDARRKRRRKKDA